MWSVHVEVEAVGQVSQPAASKVPGEGGAAGSRVADEHHDGALRKVDLD